MNTELIEDLWEASKKATREWFDDHDEMGALIITVTKPPEELGIELIHPEGLTKNQFSQVLEATRLDRGMCVAINEAWIVRKVNAGPNVSNAIKSGEDVVLMRPSDDPEKEEVVMVRMYTNENDGPASMTFAAIKEGKLGDWETFDGAEYQPWRFGDGEERIK